jgi:hypothetical protein
MPGLGSHEHAVAGQKSDMHLGVKADAKIVRHPLGSSGLKFLGR